MRNTFALFFGNRGFMPSELILDARRDMIKAVTDAGYNYIVMDESKTRYGAVETRDEGRLYHDWLKTSVIENLPQKASRLWAKSILLISSG